MTAALCANALGLLPQGAPEIWKQICSFLVPKGRGRVLVVHQYDIYRFAQGEEDFEHLVTVFDLMTMEATPLSTHSMFQNGRADGEHNALPLYGMGECWLNAVIVPDSSRKTTQLIVHGKLSSSGGRYQGLGSGDYRVFRTEIH